MDSLIQKQKVIDYIKRYVDRMRQAHDTGRGVTTDSLIRCPGCDSLQGQEWNGHHWRCLVRSCGYQFPEDLMPPSPGELKAYFKKQDKIKKFKQLEDAGIL